MRRVVCVVSSSSTGRQSRRLTAWPARFALWPVLGQLRLVWSLTGAQAALWRCTGSRAPVIRGPERLSSGLCGARAWRFGVRPSRGRRGRRRSPVASSSMTAFRAGPRPRSYSSAALISSTVSASPCMFASARAVSAHRRVTVFVNLRLSSSSNTRRRVRAVHPHEFCPYGQICRRFR